MNQQPDYRIPKDNNGTKLDFTCENHGYKTDITMGSNKGRKGSPGSALRSSLVEHTDGRSLWLEYVKGKVANNKKEQLFWFIWYDKDGKPTMNGGTVFSRTSFFMAALRYFIFRWL